MKRFMEYFGVPIGLLALTALICIVYVDCGQADEIRRAATGPGLPVGMFLGAFAYSLSDALWAFFDKDGEK